MKKIVLALCFMHTLSLFAQDSLDLEMQRLNKLGDSLHKARLVHDSLFMDKLQQSVTEMNNEINNAKFKEAEVLMQQVLREEERKQKNRRTTMFIAVGAVVAISLAAVRLQKRKKS